VFKPQYCQQQQQKKKRKKEKKQNWVSFLSNLEIGFTIPE
jgi:hypothetical protein